MKTFTHGSCCVRIFLLAIAVIIMAGCSGPKVLTKPAVPGNIIHFSKLKEWDKTKSLNNYVVYVEKGEIIPLSISMDTDFLELKQDRIDMVAKKKLYFRIKMPDSLTEDEMAKLNKVTAEGVAEWSVDQKKAFFKNYMLYVSTDAVHWAPLNGRNALREVLGYKMGTVFLGMKASTTDGLGANLKIKAIR